jgi:hypothetical protein
MLCVCSDSTLLFYEAGTDEVAELKTLLNKCWEKCVVEYALEIPIQDPTQMAVHPNELPIPQVFLIFHRQNVNKQIYVAYCLISFFLVNYV